MTRQRKVIMEELCKVTSHPTAGELCDMVRKRLPRISLGTVYRNLEILSDNGMVLKLEMAGRERRYDGCTDTHYHIRCNGCGRVADVTMRVAEALEGQAEAGSDFRVTGHRLEFEGYCPDCARQPKPN